MVIVVLHYISSLDQVRQNRNSLMKLFWINDSGLSLIKTDIENILAKLLGRSNNE